MFLRFAFGHLSKKNRRQRRHGNASLSLADARELLPQPLWRCFEKSLILFSDHKASAAAVLDRRERKRLVAAGWKPASAWSVVSNKASKRKLHKAIFSIVNKNNPKTFGLNVSEESNANSFRGFRVYLPRGAKRLKAWSSPKGWRFA